MHYPDLSEYAYSCPTPVDGVFNVGWLSKSYEYPKGFADKALLQAIAKCYPQNQVNRTRGVHICEMCGNMKSGPFELNLSSKHLGSAEIWILSPSGFVYAAPDLLMHYVESHQYSPPRDFGEAVMVADAIDWDANKECERILLNYFESQR